ncbi:MAG: hypothetical protein A2657_01490 [Candidatus Yanofskybacteria bacterium RIFCSPHIGHO2_01_FULL_44_110b]|nr:MAG: hypothetical protein A2657_01490 [Candidatus Yanofskybacteria bacterium RIFCSPHIGHO2_01_FULL_44_110b]
MFAAVVFALMVPLAGVFAENGKNIVKPATKPAVAVKVDKMNAGVEVRISRNGEVSVSGAKVTSISENTLNAATTLGSVSMTWTVNTDSSTKIVQRSGGKVALSDISAGDVISFRGTLTAASPAMTVNAKSLTDHSLETKRGSFLGGVISIGTNNFVLDSKNRGQITVNVGSDTEIKKDGSTAVLADIHVGDKVSAAGLFNNISKILNAVKIKILAETK